MGAWRRPPFAYSPLPHTSSLVTSFDAVRNVGVRAAFADGAFVVGRPGDQPLVVVEHRDGAVGAGLHGGEGPHERRNGNARHHGAAERAGLKGARETVMGQIQLGDILVAVSGKAVTTIDDLMDVMEAHKVGDQVTVEILRGNRREKVAVTLQAVN